MAEILVFIMGAIQNLFMWIKGLIAFLFLGSLVFAQKPNEQKSKVCNDLFAASCLKPDGKSKYVGRLSSLKHELNKSIEDARNKTAVSMGFKDFDDALKARLKENGLEVKEPLDADSWEKLKRADTVYFGASDSAKKLYTSVDQCDKNNSKLVSSYISNSGIEKDPVKLTEIIKNYDKLLTRYRKKRISLYAKDIPYFINFLKVECSSSKSRKEKPCKDFSQIKRQAINLFRIEGTSQYKEQAEKFVQENLLSEEGTIKSTAVTGTPEEEMVKELMNKSYLASNLCDEYSLVAFDVGTKVSAGFIDEVNKAKPTVDAIIDSFYGERKKKMATQMFQEARSDVQVIVSQFVKDPSKKTEIVDGYDRLKLFWMEKPENTSYTKNTKGVMSLDETKAAPREIRSLFEEDIFETFSDPSLSFFTTFNADYMPSVTLGKTSKNERVNVMPPIIYFLEKNPYDFLAVIAHEVGHKIGPEISKLNGYDLVLEYKDLLACYRDPKSINLQKEQEDETIADYISSEVLAREISKLPPKKRQQALMSSMENYCIFDEEKSAINVKESHAEDFLRVNGIYGANPNLRKVVGCDAEAQDFKSCGLKEVSLPLNSINNGSISTSKGVQ